VHWINAAARRLLNVPDEVVDSTVEQYFSQHEVQRMLLSPGDPRGAGEGAAESRLELSVESKPVTLLARVSGIMLPEGSTRGSAAEERPVVPGRLLVLTDITELSRALRLRSDFVANASHELRTPLAAMRGATETLQRMDLAEESAAAGRFVNMVMRHISRLEDLVSDLLNLSRLESLGTRFEPVDLRLEKFIEELADRWRDSAERKGVPLVFKVAGDCPQLRVSPHLLQLAMDNLVDNAIKFSEPSGTVDVDVRREEERLVLRVVDQGCGISDEDQERVFERFYQVARARTGTGSPSDDARGTGLGLSIVRHAVTALGGTVHLQSVLGSGTTIIVAIPFTRLESVSDA
jgi:signal transduction histidine kinase